MVINPFTAITAIWWFEVTTHVAICLSLADNYFSPLNIQCTYSEIGMPIGLQLLGQPVPLQTIALLLHNS